MITEVGMWEHFVGATGTHELQAQANESFFIRNFIITPSANDTFMTVAVDGRIIYNLRLVGYGGNHCPPNPNSTCFGIISWLRARGIELGIPVGPGEKLVLTTYAETQDIGVVFDRGTPDEFKNTDPNGSKSSIRRRIMYGVHDTALTAAGWPLINKSLSPGSLSAFPFGENCPDGRKINILGYCGCPVTEGDGAAADGYTDYVRATLNSKWLHSEDGAGFRYYAAAITAAATNYDITMSLCGPYTPDDPDIPFLLPKPIECNPGDELRYEAQVVGAAVALAVDIVSFDVILEEILD